MPAYAFTKTSFEGSTAGTVFFTVVGPKIDEAAVIPVAVGERYFGVVLSGQCQNVSVNKLALPAEVPSKSVLLRIIAPFDFAELGCKLRVHDYCSRTPAHEKGLSILR